MDANLGLPALSEDDGGGRRGRGDGQPDQGDVPPGGVIARSAARVVHRSDVGDAGARNR